MFDIRSRSSTVTREVVGGITTFMAMSYILFVQPAVLQIAGMDSGGVFMATCIASGITCIIMGLLANYPIALAPGMGENVFFVYTLCGVGLGAAAFRLTWQEGLALTAIVGVVFLAMALVGLRSRLLNSIPDALKSGIAAGIGLFIALIGFEWGHLVVPHGATFVTLAPIKGNYIAGLTLLGLAITLMLAAWRVRGAVLIGILLTTLAAAGFTHVQHLPGPVLPQSIVAMPHGIEHTAGAIFTGEGFVSLAHKTIGPHGLDVLAFGFILLFMDLFDTVGTLVGVATRAGLVHQGALPRAERALAADAMGTILGAGAGTSTVTSYIESIAGVSAGARTGLAAVVAGVCLLAAMFFQPLAGMIGAGMQVVQPDGTILLDAFKQPVLRYPMIAPALIFVGAMMIRAIRDVDWDDVTEAVPAFLTMATMAFAYSISAGIAVGFISYAFTKIASGRFRQCPLIVYIFAALWALRYALLD